MMMMMMNMCDDDDDDEDEDGDDDGDDDVYIDVVDDDGDDEYDGDDDDHDDHDSVADDENFLAPERIEGPSETAQGFAHQFYKSASHVHGGTVWVEQHHSKCISTSTTLGAGPCGQRYSL